MISTEQYHFLSAKLADSRVGHRQGQSHLEAWDVRRHLIRIFGFGGWDTEIIECTLVSERGEERPGRDGKPARMGWTVVYRVLMRLLIKDPTGTVIAHYEDGATGDASNQPALGDAHDMALKTAMSQALKRCAINLGDQFGLSLYNNGQTGPVVNRSLVIPGRDGNAEDLAGMAAAVAQDAPVTPAATDPTVEAPAEPAPEPPAPAVQMVGQQQHKRMHVLWRALGYDGDDHREQRLEITSKILARVVDTSATLTAVEADTVIERLEARRRQLRAGENGAAA